MISNSGAVTVLASKDAAKLYVRKPNETRMNDSGKNFERGKAYGKNCSVRAKFKTTLHETQSA